jgi:hypothetical protein
MASKLSFAFGGDTGIKTPQQLAREREIVDALLARRQAPRNIGEGLSDLGEAIGSRLAGRGLRRDEAAASEAGTRLFDSLFGGKKAVTGPESLEPASYDPSGSGGDTFSKMVEIESGGDPNAVSPKGATGIAQIMPDTARDPGYGLKNIFDLAASKGIQVASRDDGSLNDLLRNPDLNRTFGELYFNKMKELNGGDERLAAAAYNAGPGAVSDAGGVPAFKETQDYVEKLGLGGASNNASQMQVAQVQQPDANEMLRAISDPAFAHLPAAQQGMIVDAYKAATTAADPMKAIELEKARLELGAMQNPKISPADDARIQLERDRFEFEKARTSPEWAKLSDGSLFNERTGEVKQVPMGPTVPDIKDVTTLRKEVQDTQQIKNYMQSAPIYRSMVETADRDTRASDLNLVYGLGKIMDPTSVVREGEMVMVKNTASLPDWVQGAIARLNGGAGLKPETRKAIMAEARSRMTAYRNEAESLKKQYEGIAQRYNLKMDDIWQPLEKLPDKNPESTGVEVPAGWDPEDWKYLTPEEKKEVVGQ